MNAIEVVTAGWASARMLSMTPRSGPTDESTSGTLARGLTILELVGAHGRVGVAEIATALGISRSAAYRLVSQLRDRGFLVVDPGGEGVQLGGNTLRVGLQALGGPDLIQLAASRLRHLVSEVRETAFLATVDQDSVVYVLQEMGPYAVTMTAKPGSRRPLHCTGLGKAYLAALDPCDRTSLVETLDLAPITEATITDETALHVEIDATRARGYAIDDGELQPDVRCIAAAVRDHLGLPVASISVGGPRDRITRHEPEIIEAVLRVVSELSHSLGAPRDARKTATG